ncbi:MAG: PSD1 domain-containing protein [Verrucomicrobiae bacterium]|nr:PSD1 domain-containing protein [Verrucomicrobiae bacterium]
MRKSRVQLLRGWVGWLVATVPLASAAEPVSFSREVLPILSDRCFHCHGPDSGHRKADLRLDQEGTAKAVKDEIAAIVPGDLEKSEVWQRLIATDKDELMPPPDSHRKPLSAAEKDTLKRWIEEGAVWGRHWAFEKPVRPAVPSGADHPIDAFVRAKLAKEGLPPAPPAPPHTQLRRLSFALTGLPPSAGDLTRFSDSATRDPESAFEDETNRLLSSPHHGERLAMWWLDAARYSDTDGYQGDAERTNWPWRDWVVDAFNRNLPFDRFTVEQFAGDLLPDATPEQVLATCFHRNHMTNGEGGRDPEESRIDYVIDRVNTTGTVWLGLTLGCVQCHDHKFDPVSQRDYYSLFAFFNSIAEDGKAGGNAVPYLDYQSPRAQRAVQEMTAHVESVKPLEAEAKAAAKARFARWREERLAALPADYQAWSIARPASVVSVEGTTFSVGSDGTVQATGPNPRQDDYRVSMPSSVLPSRITGWKLEVMPHASHTEGKLSRGKKGEFILTNVKMLVKRSGISQVRDLEMRGAVADFEREAKARNYGLVKDTLDDDPRNGWTTESGDATISHTAVYELREPLFLAPDEEIVFVLLQRSTDGDANIGRFRISVTSESGETVRSVGVSPLEEIASSRARGGSIDTAVEERLFQQFLVDDRDYQNALARLDEANRQLAEVKKAAGKLKVMVLGESPEPRRTHILERGVWDAKGATVRTGVVPAILDWPAEKTRTRLDLANWLVSPDNPLTSRVVVNHLWSLMFGQGLVRSPEDFGLQGEAPTHPDLLDWLAVELVESGWDLRHVLRLIATSETFRQDSSVSPSLLERDPDNRLLARFPRQRLPAWMIRDHALSAAGLLNPALGGPPVKPWQPEGVWEEIFMGRYTYKPSVGPAQYRRTLYAYWRRSSAPTFLFDSAQRRVCEVRANRTNTPLHALTLLNDTGMLEASRVLAERVASEDPDQAISLLGEAILNRSPSTAERAVLLREHHQSLDYYDSNPADAVAFTLVGQQAALTEASAPAVAAWMTVASLILNLDEAMTME